MPLRKVLISGGGTGGHIFPAIAIANSLKKRYPGVEILFVGAMGRMEMEKVPAAGYRIEGLRISGMPRKLTWRWIPFFRNLLGSMLRGRRILREFKPDVVVGVGGYASGPMLRLAAAKGIPTVIQEQNSFPGKTNKLLARSVDRICVAYDGLDKWFPREKLVLTGNPVREEVVQLEGKRPRGAELFELDPEKKTLLVVGGSLGARSINQAIQTALPLLSENGIQLIWQTGKTYYDTARMAAEAIDAKTLKVHDFITRMDLAYAMADVVVSRAGAIAISELCLVKKPVILVPSPNVAEDHQTKNAMALVNHRAAVLVKDAEATQRLGEEILRLTKDEAEADRLRHQLGRLGFQNAADTIATVIYELVRK